MFNTLRRVRQAYHSLPGTPNDMPKAYGGTTDAEADEPIAVFNDPETGKGNYEALNPNRARKDSTFNPNPPYNVNRSGRSPGCRQLDDGA